MGADWLKIGLRYQHKALALQYEPLVG